MRPEHLQIALRPRTAWEAVELGTGLVRRHAGALWRPWLLLSLPVFAAANTLAWWLDLVWLAGFLLWWLLPLFDRIPLYVLSRAVFGQVPGCGETLRAWPKVGPGHIASHLLWRRFNLWRALCLPVDLLEDGNSRSKAQRRHLILSGQRGAGALLAWLCQWLVIILMLATVMLVFLFVPAEELLPEFQLLPALLQTPPRWIHVLGNALWWLALTLIEPFYIGAGFGLYLNRRVRLEGWDIELALRGLNARLKAGPKPPAAATLILALCLLLPGMLIPAAVLAHDAIPHSASPIKEEALTHPLADLFGTQQDIEVQRFLHTVDSTRQQDPLLNQQQIRKVWKLNTDPIQHIPATTRRWTLPEWWASMLAGLGELVLWLLLIVLIVLLLATLSRWLPWMRRTARQRRRTANMTERAAKRPQTPLPSNPSTHANALWLAGHQRPALALLYRGSLHSLAALAGIDLPRGATEAECLHLSARLQTSAQQHAFTRLVHAWQHTAYAQRWPDDAAFAALSEDLARSFGWRP